MVIWRRKPELVQQGDGGYRWVFRFLNGWGASVIRHRYSYGFDRGLFELAVLDSSGELTYATPITTDVEGYLTQDEVEELLDRIEALAQAPKES